MSDAAIEAGAGKPVPREPIFCAEREVPAEWIDYNGHMNVGYYLLAFDQALDVFFEDWLGLNGEAVAKLGMGPFSMQASLHFIAELTRGERFQVYFQLLDCDHKRWHFLCLMKEASTGRLVAGMEQLGINVDHQTRRSAPMPEALQQRFQELMAAHRDLPRPDMVGAPIGIRR